MSSAVLSHPSATNPRIDCSTNFISLQLALSSKLFATSSSEVEIGKANIQSPGPCRYVKGGLSRSLTVRNLQLSLYGLPFSMAYMCAKDGWVGSYWTQVRVGSVLRSLNIGC